MEKEEMKQLRQEVDRLLENNQAADALPIIRQMAHWSDLDMQILAKNILLHGLYGMAPNAGQAFEYARLAAMNGDPASMADLGRMFKEGRGTARDYEKARYFLEKAVSYKEPSAYVPLAGIYLLQLGTQRNLDKAAWLLEQADSRDEQLVRYQKLLEKLRQE